VLELADLRSKAALSARQKNAQTIIGKLRVQPKMQLSNMQDIAGARLNVNGGRRLQDEIVGEICRRFPGHKPAKDRRNDPSHGYRAVHVVVPTGGCWAEVQVRTYHQDRWAQTFERLGDQWGRQIRLGQEPDHPEEITMVDGAPVLRSEVVRYMLELSDMTDDVEEEEVRVLELTDTFRAEEASLAPVERETRWQAMLATQRGLHGRWNDISDMFMAVADAAPFSAGKLVEIDYTHAAAPGLVQHFLVVYCRSTGVLEQVRAFAENELAQAVESRSRIEEANRNNPDLEVVLLVSGSERELRSTHARYFEGVGQLSRSRKTE
jgi:ppGpp synthetase/RelA/SpoT-type nucleotidyltranferase